MTEDSRVILKISNRLIGKDHPCFIVAEIGQNHQGDLEMAKKMILKAKECGVDCVKFQRSNLEAKFTKIALERPYRSSNAFGATYGDHKRFLEFSLNDFQELKQFSEENGMIFGASAMDPVALEELLEMGVAFVKIGSGDANNFPLIRKARDSGRPLIISTGMQNDEVIETIYTTMRGNPFGLLHCVSAYPTEACDINLQHMVGFQKKFPAAVIGYSGHEIDSTISVAAAAMGAAIIERHFTLDRNLKGSDHRCSLEPHQMAQLVKDIRKVEVHLDQQLSTAEEVINFLEHLHIFHGENNHQELKDQLKAALGGEKERKLLKCEEECFRKLGKSLVYTRDVPCGEEITPEHLSIKVSHPKGIPPEDYDKIVGRKLSRSVEVDTPVRKDDLQPIQ